MSIFDLAKNVNAVTGWFCIRGVEINGMTIVFEFDNEREMFAAQTAFEVEAIKDAAFYNKEKFPMAVAGIGVRFCLKKKD